MPGTALITGITGQDGTYLASCCSPRATTCTASCVDRTTRDSRRSRGSVPGIEFIEGDLLDHSSLVAALESCQPTEVYNLGAISFVGLSFKQALLTGEITGLGVVRMLEAIRTVNQDIRFYQASSSEMFGKVRESPQTELTAVPPALPVRGGQGVRPLHHRQLPRELRHVRLQRHPLQP